MVRKLIPKYLKSHSSSSEALYEASEFFRKITDHKSALRLLPKESALASQSRSSDKFTKLELQLARILNILGASNYALRVVERIRSENRAKSKVEIAEIYFCNFKFSELLNLLGADLPLPASEPWHQDWLLHFYLAIALSELKQTKEAIQRVEGIHALSASPLIRAIALSYKGKFLLAAGEPEKALLSLREAGKFFQHKEKTADDANFLIFLGECLLALAQYKEAESCLTEALKLTYKPSMRPEDWIEVILLLEKIPGFCLDEQRFSRRLRALFGADYPLLKWTSKSEQRSSNEIFSLSDIHFSKKKMHLDRASDTAWIDGKARLGLDLVDELICYLVYAGKYGLPQFRLYELLWPHEPFSFDQHQKRLERVVGRARAQGYTLSWEDLHVRLLSKNISATGHPDTVIRGRSFLVEHTRFTRREVEVYFSISSAGAKVLCRSWIEAGLVVLSRNSYDRITIPIFHS